MTEKIKMSRHISELLQDLLSAVMADFERRKQVLYVSGIPPAKADA